MSAESGERGREETAGRDTLPAAVLRPSTGLSWAWIVPALAVVLAGWLALAAWRERGLTITVQLPRGHGLRAGDPVRYRGINVGEVSHLDLAEDLGSVVAHVRLRTRARRLARAGSRFWVVHPRLGLSGVEGLETLLGPRYLAAMPLAGGPAPASPQRRFVGLGEPPVVESIAPGDLEIVLQAQRREGIRPGAAVTYRQVRVGTVLSVGLNSDGSSIELRVHVLKAYRGLIRRHTRFWVSGGVRADVGFSGLSLQVESLAALITGGIALATPPPEDAGAEVRTGHRFVLAAEPEDEWLSWKPVVAIGNTLLPPGAVLPQPLRATIGWEQGFILKAERSRRGWVLQTREGLLGPADLLTPDPGRRADRETVSLDVAGEAVPLEASRVHGAGELAHLDAQVSAAVWPDAGMRGGAEPEDCIAVADPTAAPLPLAASHLTAGPGRWLVDGAVPCDRSWHGACVLSRRDGKLVGILIVEKDRAHVAVLPSSS